jgi:hypothetical protein
MFALNLSRDWLVRRQLRKFDKSLREQYESERRRR